MNNQQTFRLFLRAILLAAIGLIACCLLILIMNGCVPYNGANRSEKDYQDGTWTGYKNDREIHRKEIDKQNTRRGEIALSALEKHNAKVKTDESGQMMVALENNDNVPLIINIYLFDHNTPGDQIYTTVVEANKTMFAYLPELDLIASIRGGSGTVYRRIIFSVGTSVANYYGTEVGAIVPFKRYE